MRWQTLIVIGLASVSLAQPKKRVVTRKPSSPAPFDQRLATLGDPVVTASRAIVIDADSGAVLWSRNADDPAYPASTTKVCTALVFAESCKPQDMVVAPKGIEKVGEASLNLREGESLNGEDLLAAILLRSANDACVAAAVHVSGSVEAFAELMNKKAAEVGCTNTHFTNPNGLHDPHHMTTAHDLAMLGRAAIKVPRIADIVGHRRRKIARSMMTGDVNLLSKNNLLDLDPTCIGIKTGWTIPAGHCFVGAFERDGMTFVTATMGSSDWRQDHIDLASFAAEHFQPAHWAKKGTEMGEAKVVGGLKDSVKAVAATDASILIKRGGPEPVAQVELKSVNAPIKAGQVIGRAFLPGVAGASVDLLAASSIEAKPKPSGNNPAPWLVGAGVSGLVVARWMGGKRRRRAR